MAGFHQMPPTQQFPQSGEDEVDALEARFRALSGGTTPGGAVQSPQRMPDFLDELDTMWKNSAAEGAAAKASSVGPVLAQVDSVLTELDASYQAVSFGQLLPRKPAPSGGIGSFSRVDIRLASDLGTLCRRCTSSACLRSRGFA